MAQFTLTSPCNLSGPIVHYRTILCTRTNIERNQWFKKVEITAFEVGVYFDD
jgi:hypothetical protein